MPSDMTFRTLVRPAALVMALALCPLVAAAQEPDERDLQALRFYMNENNEQAIQSELLLLVMTKTIMKMKSDEAQL